jgi:hypothetical protein
VSWITFELRSAFYSEFAEITGIDHFDRGEYSQQLRTSFGPELMPGLERNAQNVKDLIEINHDQIRGEFESALFSNGSKFLDWLSAIGVDSDGVLATDLLRAQALFSILTLVTGGYDSLEVRMASQGESSCWWPFPFC